jgi:DNA-binding MarR family transcriptional regulator
MPLRRKFVDPGRPRPVHAAKSANHKTVDHKPHDYGPPVRRAPPALARRFHQICLSIAAEEMDAEGLMPIQLGVLTYLYDSPGIEQAALAARLGIDRASTSQMVDRLEARGIVERCLSTTDRRVRLLRLTPAGRTLRMRLQPKMDALNDRILAPLASSERRILLDLLVRVVEGNRAHARPGAARRKPNARPPASKLT